MSRLSSFAATLLTITLCAGAANAQSTFGSITGTVTDATGAAVPETTITAVHKTAGLTYTTRANTAGVYTLPDLRDGEYTVRATLAGFKEFVREGIVLEVRAVRRLDIRMEVGAVTERVEVVAEAGAIETERATVSAIRSEQYLTRTGLSANGLWAAFLTFPMTSQRGSSPSFAGTRNDQYQMTVDGASINSGSGGVISNLGGENQVFKDMRIDMVNAGAEHSGLAHVLLVTKSGENDLHGNAFFNYQSPAFRARDFFATQAPTGINRRFGFDVGGPLVLPKLYNGKNRTFWHFSANKVGGSKLRDELRPTVPLEAWRKGDFSALGIQIRNPITGDVYTDGKIPASALNSTALKIQEMFYPLPNIGDTSNFVSRNHLSLKTGPSSEERRTTAKLDQRFSDNDYTYLSFQMHQVDVNDWDGDLPAFDFKKHKRITKSLAGVWTHTFNASMVNETRFSHAFNTYPRRGKYEGREIVSLLGLQGLNADLPEGGGVFKVGFSGLGITGISQTDQLSPGAVNNNTSIANDFSFFRGRHNLKMGFLYGWIGYDNQSLGSNTFGQATFSSNYSKVAGVSKSGHAYADFLFGTPTTSNRGAMGPLDARRRNVYDFYFQDQWKVASWVTLSLGMRYEYHAAWTSVNGTLSTFDPVTGQVVVPDAGMSAVSKFVPQGYVNIVSASSAGLPAKSLVYSDRNNFQPRFSAAFRPFRDNRTVISAGFSVAHDAGPFSPTAGGTPFAVDEPSFTNTPNTPTVVLPFVFPLASSGRLPTMSLPSAANAHIQLPRSHQWSVTISREQWDTGFSARYVGTATRQMWWSRDLNSPPVDDRLYSQKARPFPKYPNISYNDNGSNHTYQALVLEANRKVGRGGPMFQAGYTWARDLGDDANPEDPFNRSRERAPDSTLPNQRFSVTMFYDLPFGHGKALFSGAPRLADKLIADWQLSVTSSQQTGSHLTPAMSVQDPTGTRYTTSASRPLITIRPDLLTDPNVGGKRDQTNWYNLSAFGTPAIGRFGTSARGVVNGPGVNVIHASIHKTIALGGERAPKLVVGLMGTNIFNHTNLGNPNMTISTLATAATITSTGGPNASAPSDRAGARNLWLSLRLEW